jgi:hypothetical protein
MPPDRQKGPGLPAGLFKNSLLLWQERYKAERPDSPAKPVAPKKIRPPKKKGRRAGRPR